jgi:hypothetical protein
MRFGIGQKKRLHARSHSRSRPGSRRAPHTIKLVRKRAGPRKSYREWAPHEVAPLKSHLDNRS